MNTNKYAGVKLLLGAYLHQDFLDEFATAMEAVESFARTEPVDVVRAAVKDIDLLLTDEQFLHSPDEFLSELGSCYVPGSDGMTAIEWLRRVRSTLQNTAFSRSPRAN